MSGFFHDRGCFSSLAQMIPPLFEGRSSRDFVRVWAPACGAGEDAYSLGMLFLDEAARHANAPGIQIFGCDRDGVQIAMARAGIYSGPVARSAGKARFRRFFVQHGQDFQVKHELRKIILFAVHDAGKDAPFARMDVIACGRWLDQQDVAGCKRFLEQCRFALKDGGLLCVGAGVKLPRQIAGYETLDSANQIYRREPDAAIGSLRYASASALLQAVEAEERARAADHRSLAARRQDAAKPAGAAPALAENALRHIERLAPASAIIGADGCALHLTQEMQQFLEPGADVTRPLPSLLLRSLRARLRSALGRAMANNRQVIIPRAPVRLKDQAYEVQITMAPAPELGPGLFIVSFDRLASPGGSVQESPEAPVVRMLENEIQSLRAQLRETETRHAMGRAELDVRNEELEVANAGLRSTTEELEASQQELQSMNEELSAVNRELSETIGRLERANSDLTGFLDATGIAAIFLDRDLKIVRYSPAATSLFRLIPGDVGRPLAQLRHVFKREGILDDAAEALKSRRPLQRRLEDGSGRTYLADMLPHRDGQSRLRGVVLTFVELKS